VKLTRFAPNPNPAPAALVRARGIRARAAILTAELLF
jgi:hypothetical protein